MTRKPIKMLIGSVLLMLFGGYVIYSGYASADESVIEYGETLEENSAHVAPKTIDTLSAGGPLTIWARGTTMLHCTAEGGSGSISMAPPEPLTIPGPAGEDFHLAGVIRSEPGRYVITCENPEGARFGISMLPVEKFRESTTNYVGGLILGGGVGVVGLVFFLMALVRRSEWKKAHRSVAPEFGQAPTRGPKAAEADSGPVTGWEHLVVPGSAALPGYPAPPDLIGTTPPVAPPLPPPVEQHVGSVQ